MKAIEQNNQPEVTNRLHASDFKTANTSLKVDVAAAHRIIKEIRERRERLELERSKRGKEDRAMTDAEREQWSKDNAVLFAAMRVIDGEGNADEPKNPELMTEAERQKELKSIAAEINTLEDENCQDERKAAKILIGTVYRARTIGMRLARVKALLKHGQYTDWVEENFIGGESTARTYKQIAECKNWAKIQPQLSELTSIRQLLGIMKETAAAPSPLGDSRLLRQLKQEIDDWPEHVCETLAADDETMKIIKAACKQHYGQIRLAQKAKDDEARRILATRLAAPPASN